MKKNPIGKWKKNAFTKVQLQNGNNSKCKMKNENKILITNGNENPIWKWK